MLRLMRYCQEFHRCWAESEHYCSLKVGAAIESIYHRLRGLVHVRLPSTQQTLRYPR